MASTPTPYSAHIGYLFTELPFRDRVGAAKKHGFSAVQYPAPYDTSGSVMAEWLADTILKERRDTRAARRRPTKLGDSLGEPVTASLLISCNVTYDTPDAAQWDIKGEALD